MKYYLKEDYDIFETILAVEDEVKHVKSIERPNLFMIYYDPDNEMDREVVRVNKTDRRVVFSATSTVLRNWFKDKVVTM